MKIIIPTILAATILVAMAFALMPVERVSSTHASGGAAGGAATDVTCTGCVDSTDIANTSITDTDISATAAIAKSKLAALNIADADVAAGAAIAGSKLANPLAVGALQSDTSLRVGGATGAVVTLVREFTLISVDPPSIPATNATAIAVTVTGAAVGDFVAANPPTALASGLLYMGARVTAADTVTITIFNNTAAPIDDIARNWDFIIIRT